ncbi:MAG: hypothetical protein AAFV45_11845 [Pseudomonadota bacterium]
MFVRSPWIVDFNVLWLEYSGGVDAQIVHHFCLVVEAGFDRWTGQAGQCLWQISGGDDENRDGRMPFRALRAA